jgi:3-deoxy-D-manno-octulosonic acid kinase
MMREDKSSNCYFLQQRDDPRQLLDEYFEAGYWRQRPGYEVISSGRGGSVRIEMDGRAAILRRYHRGGAVGKLLSDQYLWMGKTLSRPWREWKILERARRAGLPVPKPIAASICRSGLWYRAVLITAYLQDTETLTQRLQRTALKPGCWHRIGLLVKRMHAAGIRHADLTSDNILIDSQDRFYLIDFDMARVMNRIDDWQWRPLYRFQRSIEKRHRKQKLHFDDGDWQALMDGYQS